MLLLHVHVETELNYFIVAMIQSRVTLRDNILYHGKSRSIVCSNH